MNQSVVEKLQQVRKLILAGWTQDTYARDSLGNETNISSPDAVNFCLVGAVMKASGGFGLEQHRIFNSISLVLKKRGEHTSLIWDWNDEPGRTKEQVIELLDEAIALEEG